MTLKLSRVLGPAIAALAMLSPAQAQQQQPQPPQQQNPVCVRLESQLQAFDRGGSDAGRAEQVRKYEDAAAKQQTEIDRQQATAQRMGCEGNSFFVLFNRQPQCGPLNAKIQQMRDNLDHIQSDLERMRGGSGPEREGQRRAILVALSQNGCGAQYQAQVAATPPQRGGLFESLFGPKSVFTPDNSPQYSAPGGTYRTICVRTCDGYYYPISYATSPNSFAEDEKKCQQSCPASEAQLYTYRNPGETVEQAVSATTQQPYTSLPTAFRYRQTVDKTCSCRHPGESWSQALKNIEDGTVEQGDIVVNEQRAKAMSQPRVDAQGRPIKPDPRANATPAPKAAQTPPPKSAPEANVAPVDDTPPGKPDPNRKVRSVGPPFITAQ
jgi:hypothetical protein